MKLKKVKVKHKSFCLILLNTWEKRKKQLKILVLRFKIIKEIPKLFEVTTFGKKNNVN